MEACVLWPLELLEHLDHPVFNSSSLRWGLSLVVMGEREEHMFLRTLHLCQCYSYHSYTDDTTHSLLSTLIQSCFCSDLSISDPEWSCTPCFQPQFSHITPFLCSLHWLPVAPCINAACLKIQKGGCLVVWLVVVFLNFTYFGLRWVVSDMRFK